VVDRSRRGFLHPQLAPAGAGPAVRREFDQILCATLLCLLILSITLGPRLRAGYLSHQRAVDLRPQDLLLIPAAFVVLAHLASPVRPVLRRWWALWSGFCLLAAGTTILHLLISGEATVPTRLAFLGRGIELVLIVGVVCGLYRQCGPSRLRLVHGTLLSAAFANAAWCLYQAYTGRPRTLLGGEVGSAIESYGPKLVGEPSAFGAGAFFVFVAVLAIARYRGGLGSRPVSVALLVAAAVCTYLAQSRAALVAIACLMVIFILSADHAATTSRLGKVTLLATAAVPIVLAWDGPVSPRLTESGVMASTEVRLAEVWTPITHLLVNDPLVGLLGVGPGGLATKTVPQTEAHNAVLRAWLDYGLVGGAVLLLAIGSALWYAYRTARSSTASRSLRFHADLVWLFGVAVLVLGTVQDALTPVTSSHLLMLAIGLFAGELSHATVAERDGGGPARAPAGSVGYRSRGRWRMTPRRAAGPASWRVAGSASWRAAG